MAKYVVLAFDDGRIDQYKNAATILKKHNLVGSFYITTGYVDGTAKNIKLLNKAQPMTIDNVKQIHDWGLEVGSHSDTHVNEISDIMNSIEKLRLWTKQEAIGFASPHSAICDSNVDKYMEIEHETLYIRSGCQVRREGWVYSLAFVINQNLQSDFLYRLLNQRFINRKNAEKKYIDSIAIRNNTKRKQILRFLNDLEDNDCCVLLFHSILSKEEANNYPDCWYYDKDEFERLCLDLKKGNCSVITLEGYQRMRVI